MISAIVAFIASLNTGLLTAQASTTSLDSLLSAMSAVVSKAIIWIGEYVTCITGTGHEILLWGVIIGAVGLGVGLIKRIMRI